MSDWKYIKIYSMNQSRLLKSIVYLNKVTIIRSEEDKHEIFKEYHDSILAGHRGINQTTSKITQVFYRKNIDKKINNYAIACKIWKKNKISYLLTRFQ